MAPKLVVQNDVLLLCYLPKVTYDPICALLACLQYSVVDSLASLVSACLIIAKTVVAVSLQIIF